VHQIARLIATAAFLTAAATALAGPSPAAGYDVEVTHEPGTMLCGLARDGDAVVVTDLAGGRLLRRRSDGRLTAFGPVLPHGVDVIGEPTGPYTIARHGSRFLVAQGATPAGKSETAHDHALLDLDEAGSVRVINREFWTPFDFVVADETIYVADGARNSVERLRGDGDRRTLFAFARLTTTEAALKSLSPTEFAGARTYELDAVPTGIAVRDGRLYVALFGGFPYLAGAGRVVSLPLAGEIAARVEAVDLNAPLRIAFDRDGRLLVVEHGTYEQTAGFAPESGRLVRIDLASGQRDVLLDGLTRPGGILVVGENHIMIAQLDGTLIDLKRKSARRR
jgi:hypothetical protein